MAHLYMASPRGAAGEVPGTPSTARSDVRAKGLALSDPSALRREDVGRRATRPVAQYRFSAQVIKRSDGRSATAAAAYRAGERIVDERLEMPFDYRARHGVEHTEIMRPEHSPERFADRAVLWNAVEAAEKRLDAQVAREVQLSLPHELDAEQRRALVREYVQREFVDKGMVADVAIHAPDEDGDQRNHHAHVILTTRRVDEAGFGEKERAWNTRPQLAEWRAQWAETQNRHLAQALGPDAPQVTHKSLEDQGIERAATIHLGPTASAIERKGERSDRGEVNRQIAAENVERRDIRKEITATYDRHAEVSPQTQSSTASLKTELANYQKQMQRQAAEWKAEKAAIVVPETVKIASVRREIVGPARAELRAAEAKLEHTRDRTKTIAAKRTSLASFIRNPARAIWAKIKEVHALDRARYEVALARANVKVREEWLRSDPGRAYVAGKVDTARVAAEPIKQQARTLDRKIRRVEKRITTVETVRERLAVAEQLGVKSVTRPVRTIVPEQLVRKVDAALMSTFARATPQQLQMAQQTVRSIGLTRGFTR